MITNYRFTTKLQQRPDRHGRYQVELLLNINGKLKRLGTGIKVLPGQLANGKVINHEEAAAYNMVIQREAGRVNDIFIRAKLMDVPLTIESFCKQYDNPLRKTAMLPALTALAEELRPGVVPGTYKSYLQCLEKLRQFEPSAVFGGVDAVWLQQWELWLMARGLGQNTISKHHKVLKMLLGQCVNRNLLLANPYDNYQYKRVKGNRQALRGHEVQRLKKLLEHNLPPHLENTLRMFLFSCATGLRLSDMVSLHHSHISGGNLVVVPQKTQRFNTMVNIPLGENVLRLVTTRHGRLFKGATHGQVINRNLNTLKEMAGIAAPVTFHIARHTFATLYLESGGKPEVLMKLMGITKWETIQIYIHIAEERKREALASMDAWFK